MKGVLTHTEGRERGQALVEYALILVLIAILVIIVLSILGPAVGDVFSNVVRVLDEGPPSGGGAGEEPGADCYGSLLLPYFVGLTTLLLLVFWLIPNRSEGAGYRRVSPVRPLSSCLSWPLRHAKKCSFGAICWAA